MRPADILIAVMVAIIWGLAFVASRLALDELWPELMTALMLTVIGGIAVMLLAKRPQAVPKTA
jgi:hypothetical protein